VLPEELDVLEETRSTFLWAEGQGNLGTPEAHALSGNWVWTSAIEVDAISHSTTDEAVHRLIAQLTQQIPQCKVNDRDDSRSKTLATVEDRGKVHLLEEAIRVARVSANEEALKVLVNEPTGWRTAEASGKANGAICGFKLNDEAAQNIDAERGAR
jgi:hypothetical protein